METLMSVVTEERMTLVGEPVPPRTRPLTRSLLLLRAAGAGLVLTLIPILLGMVLSRESFGSAAYLSLCRWDGGWYTTIADYGYHEYPEWRPGLQTNLAFFPAYPLLGRGIHWLTGLSFPFALLLGAQLASWGFWALLIHILQERKIPPGVIVASVLFLWTQPAAFYLVVAYSESLFLLALLAFVVGCEQPKPGWSFLGGMAGLVMTATRLVGIPLAFYPLARGWFMEQWFSQGRGRRCRWL